MYTPTQFLKNLISMDEEIISIIIHGSYIERKTKIINFKEIRIFNQSVFLGSIFIKQMNAPDIDVMCISKNIQKTAQIVSDHSTKWDNELSLTMNIMSQSVFENSIFIESPSAIKRILALRPCEILEGEQYFFEQKELALNQIKDVDVNFQDEFSRRKEFIRSVDEKNIDIFTLSANQYSRKYPLFVDFISGKLNAGFPTNRIKLVLPNSVPMKFKLDISNWELDSIN